MRSKVKDQKVIAKKKRLRREAILWMAGCRRPATFRRSPNRFSGHGNPACRNCSGASGLSVQNAWRLGLCPGRCGYYAGHDPRPDCGGFAALMKAAEGREVGHA